MNRREFITCASSMAVLLANGDVLKAGDVHGYKWDKKKIKLRFVVASDGHYGQKDTEYVSYFETLVNRVNEEHAANPFEFCMINGDIIHDDKQYFSPAKDALDKLLLKYYVSQGNHDHATAGEWEAIWKMPLNHDFKVKKNSFLIATTSDESGVYLCPDVQWIKRKLDEHKKQENIFIFLHINPGKLGKSGVDCPELFEVFSEHKNIKAVFNGHDHDEEGVKLKGKIPFIFDGHFGGNWGTAYRGFRVVELLQDNTLVTYIMDPMLKINEAIL